jgi:hypothetical protein
VTPVQGQVRYQVTIRLIDIYGLPAAGVQAEIVVLPAGQPVTVENPPPTDSEGYATGYVSSSQEVCVTLEIHAAGVVLLEKPVVCFHP